MNLLTMTREEAIDNLSAATGEPKDIVEYRADYIGFLPIVNHYEDMPIPIEKPNRKSYESPYAKFDKIRRKRK